MTKMKTMMSILGTVAAIALASGAAAQDVTLRLHQFLPEQAAVPATVLKPWMEKITAESDGRIAFEHYPAMQLGGSPPQLIDQATDGIADVVWTVVGYTPNRFPSMEVFELPFMQTNAKAMTHTVWDMFEEHMKDTEFQQVHVLGAWTHGPGLLHTDEPVQSVSDLNGMKIRGGSRPVNSLLTTLGATPVGMPVPATAEALSKGVIDGTTVPWEVTSALKIPELVHNHTEFEGAALYTIVFALAMNKDKYESLPDDLKAVVDANSGLEFSIWAAGQTEAADAPARQIAVDLGNNIIQLDAAQTEEWRTAAQPVYDSWIADVSSKGIDGQALIDEAHTLLEKYTPQYATE